MSRPRALLVVALLAFGFNPGLAAAQTPLSYQLTNTNLTLQPSVPGFVVTPSKLAVLGERLTVSGGRPPYTVTASSPAVTVTPERFSPTFRVKAAQPGAATLFIRDAAGAEVTAQMTVTMAPAPVAPLLIQCPSRILKAGASVTFTVTGGRPPYRLRVQDGAAAVITPAGPSAFCARSVRSGVTELTILDQADATQGLRLEPEPFAVSLDTSSIVVLGRTTLRARGGQEPYTLADVDRSKVLTASARGEVGAWEVVGAGPCTMTLVVRDAAGASRAATLTVAPQPPGPGSVPIQPPVDDGSFKPTLTPTRMHLLPPGNPLCRITLNLKGGTPPFTVAPAPCDPYTLTKIDERTYHLTGKAPSRLPAPAEGSVRVADGGKPAERGWTCGFTIVPPLYARLLPSATTTVGGRGVVEFQSGVRPYSVVVEGSPPGLTITQPIPSGALEGTASFTATQPGTYRLRAVDGGNSYQIPLVLTVTP